MSEVLDVPLHGWLKPIWTILALRAHDRNECWPSLERLEKDTGASKPTICRALVELERLGLIQRDSPGGGKTTRYYVNCNAAKQLTVTQGNTKERERHIGDISPRENAARRELEKARVVLRRGSVRSTFLALCEMYPDGVSITAPMVARELGMRPAAVRSDLLSMIKSMDIPIEQALRFGATKRKPWHSGKLKNVVPFRQAAR